MVAVFFYQWSMKNLGKRNTIWLFGPATTGKTNLAQAIAHASNCYGCVNWSNENFPWNDCHKKKLIWWEEGCMSQKFVEGAKAILGGTCCRVDVKGKSSTEIQQTPCILTSNTDMTNTDMTRVIDGNQMSDEHKKPLQERMTKFFLKTVLKPTFGKITAEEVKSFFFRGEELHSQAKYNVYAFKFPNSGSTSCNTSMTIYSIFKGRNCDTPIINLQNNEELNSSLDSENSFNLLEEPSTSSAWRSSHLYASGKYYSYIL